MAKKTIFIPGANLVPGVNDPDEIQLDSRARRQINNAQCRDKLPPGDEFDNLKLEAKYRGSVQKRGPATLLYNCHGLTFASRRTRIYTDEALAQILAEDEYEVVEKPDVLPGDIILYFSEKGAIDHSGIVVCSGKPPLEEPTIVSKWGSGPEVIHKANLCDYSVIGAKYYRHR